jgi:hypothetical protein
MEQAATAIWQQLVIVEDKLACLNQKDFVGK